MAEASSEDESRKRAELFETLAHTARIKILRALEGQNLSFAELKRALGIESAGNLQHHLGKLDYLVRQTYDGKYAVSDDGKEALRMLDTMKLPPRSAEKPLLRVGRPFNASTLSLAVLSALLLMAVLIQHAQIVKLSEPSIPLYEPIDFTSETLRIGDSEYYYLALSSASLANNTRITFRGVTFTYSQRHLEGRVWVFQFTGAVAPSVPEVVQVVENASVVFTRENVTGRAHPVTTVAYVITPCFEVEFSDGTTEVVPLLSWPPELVRAREAYIFVITTSTIFTYERLGDVFLSFTAHAHPRAGVFLIGLDTMVLLVSSG